MHAILDDRLARQAAEHLAKVDPKFARLVAHYGPCPIRQHHEYYRQLVRSIVVQQLSVKAADVIFRRFQELFGTGKFPPPEAILQKSVEELKNVGLSRSKATYIRDLAQHSVDGRVKFDHFDASSNDDVIAELTTVKGIGEWTAHMFLMFCMGRADVLAPGDLGIRNAVRKLYDLDTVPSPDDVKHIAAKSKWHPYETVACWYLWRSLENTPD